MGHRANLIIKKNNQWQLYYDHWCANFLDIELFWGEQYAFDFITQGNTNEHEWLDEVWCEGACILDYDRQHLLWFGGEDVFFEVDIREAHLFLMQQQWQNWTIEWADNGIFDVADYLNLPKKQFIVHDENAVNNALYFVDSEDSQWEKQWNNMLLTIYKDNNIQYSQIYGDYKMLKRGIKLLDNLLSMPLYDSYQWCGDEFPQLGLHIDLEKKNFCYWHCETDMDRIHKKVIANSLGWHCINWKTDYHKHLSLLNKENISLPIKSMYERQVTIIENINNNLTRVSNNPAIELAKRFNDKGSDVTVSSATQICRGSVGTTEWKENILQQLKKQLPIE